MSFPPGPPDPGSPGAPEGPPPYGWNAVPSPPRRNRGPLIAVIAIVAVAAIVVLAGVAVVAVNIFGEDGSADKASGRLKTPIRFQQVMAETPGPCAGAGTSSVDRKTCYQIVPGMTVTRVKSIEVVTPDPARGRSSWAIELSFDPADARAFAQLSAKAAAAGVQQPGNRIAIVVGDAVVSAPSVPETIAGGQIQIAGGFDERAARRLFDQITGTGD